MPSSMPRASLRKKEADAEVAHRVLATVQRMRSIRTTGASNGAATATLKKKGRKIAADSWYFQNMSYLCPRNSGFLG